MDSWEEVSSLRSARYRASACSLGKRVYVFGGKDHKNEENYSIEILIRPGSKLVSEIPAWYHFPLSKDSFNACIDTIFVPLNEHEIVILGGYRSAWLANSSQVVIYDTKTRKVEKLSGVSGLSQI